MLAKADHGYPVGRCKLLGASWLLLDWVIKTIKLPNQFISYCVPPTGCSRENRRSAPRAYPSEKFTKKEAVSFIYETASICCARDEIRISLGTFSVANSIGYHLVTMRIYFNVLAKLVTVSVTLIFKGTSTTQPRPFK